MINIFEIILNILFKILFPVWVLFVWFFKLIHRVVKDILEFVYNGIIKIAGKFVLYAFGLGIIVLSVYFYQ